MSFRLSSLAGFSAVFLVAGGIAVTQAQAVVPQSTSAVDTNETGLAMQGYDAVAYFTDGKPVKGKPDFKAEHDGATYYFASADHLQKFTANPAAYLPQYGGFCAMGAAIGRKVEGDPTIWKVVDQKLYLNFNPDVAVRWNKDIPGNVAKADGNWPDIRNKTPKELE